jgi:RNA polymerase sigma-70 factor (ECF subfamily)
VTDPVAEPDDHRDAVDAHDSGAEDRLGADVLARLLDDLDDGFAELVRAYQRIVYSVALRVTGHPADAEDLAAEAFLRAYRALRGYDRDRIASLRPRGWLLTILLNAWRNAARDASRRPRQVAMSDTVDPPAGGAGVEEVVEADETLRELAAMLAELPPAHRMAVVLRHVVGLPMAEVAAVLGCPEGTAKSYVSRGLARLRAAHPSPPAGVVMTIRRGKR